MARFNRSALPTLLSLITTATALAAAACGPGEATPSPLPATVPTKDNTSKPVKDNAAKKHDESTGQETDDGRQGAAAPQIVLITPASLPASASSEMISVSGNGFVARSLVEIDGAPVATTFVSSQELRAQVGASLLREAGARRVSVATAAPGGGRSAERTLAITNPAPAVTQLAPASVEAGSGDTAVTVTGSGFVATSKASLGSDALATTYVDERTLRVVLPAARLATSGSLPLVVTNAAPGGGASVAASFTVAAPGLALASISPATALAGATDLVLTVRGSSFAVAARITLNGVPLATTYVDASTLSAVVPAQNLVAGDLPVAVVQGAATSAPKLLAVAYARPTLTGISPSYGTVGAARSTLTLTGSGFHAGKTRLLVGNVAWTSTVQSAQSLVAVVPAGTFDTARTLVFRTENPTPGGGASNEVPFVIGGGAACADRDAQVLSITTPSATTEIPLTWVKDAATCQVELELPRFLWTATAAEGNFKCPLAALDTVTRAYAVKVVQNATNRSLYLETFAKCTATTDAYMAIYKGDQIPVAEAARRACAGWVANGSGGHGAFASSNLLSGTSTYCPGLNRASGLATSPTVGGAVLLAPGEKALVFVQPYGGARPTHVQIALTP